MGRTRSAHERWKKCVTFQSKKCEEKKPLRKTRALEET
jgi:hypothetical protein